MRIEITHYDNGKRVVRTEKVVKLLGITILRKVYHYPEIEAYEVVNNL